MKQYFEMDPTLFPFILFSPPHLIVLILFSLGFILFFHFGPRIIHPSFRHPFRWGLASFLLMGEVSWQTWLYLNDAWKIQYSLPLELCSISALLAALLLLIRNPKLFPFVYFCGIAGATQALITPALEFSFPHFRFFHFFAIHGAIILAALYMVRVEGMRPRPSSIGQALLQLNLVALLIGAINRKIDGNYMFLSAKPPGPSLLDWLGPWPWYLLSMELVALGCFALLYLPFLFTERKKAEQKSYV